MNMKKLVCLFLLVICLASNVFAGDIFHELFNETKDNKYGVKDISYEQFTDLRDSEEKYVLLDVLGADTYASGHIPDAENFPVYTISEKSASERLPEGTNIVVYCANFQCHASTTAAKKLLEMGYKVLDYKGGRQEWIEKGNDLVQ